MRISFILLFCLFAGHIGFSQDRQLNIPLKSGEVVTGVYNMSDGILIHKQVYGKTSSLHYISNDPEQSYPNSLEGKGLYAKYPVSSPGGEYTYFIAYEGGSLIKKSVAILSQMDKNGKIRKSDMEVEVKGESWNTFIADSRYYYLVSTAYLKEDNRKKEKRMILHRVSHTTLEYKRMVLDLPSTEADETSFWAITQVAEEGFYLVSKTTEGGKQKASLLKISPDGKTEQENTYYTDLGEKFFRPSNNYYAVNNTRYKDFRDFSAGFDGKRTVYYHTDGAFSGTKIDPVTKEVYVFGIYGPTPYKGLRLHNTGYFVHKFTPEGELVWKLSQEVPAALKNNQSFLLHAVPQTRLVSFETKQDKSSGLKLGIKDEVYSFDISATGSVERTYNHDFAGWASESDLNLCFAPEDKSPLALYLSGKEVEKNTEKFQVYPVKGGYILMEKDKKSLNLLFFSDSELSGKR